MKQGAVNRKLLEWQQKFQDSKNEYQDVLKRMDQREDLYRGDREITPLVKGDTRPGGGNQKTPHVRNIIAEIVESQVNSAIPQPKVTAR